MHIVVKIVIAGIASLSASALSLYFLVPFLAKKAFLDIPNERSSHTKVTPRGGGLGVLAGIFAGSLAAYLLQLPLPHISFFAGLLLMAGTSFIDDKKNLPVYIRLGAHIFAMGLVIYYSGGLKKLPFPYPLNIDLGWIGYLISGIWIVSVINFYNFLDGIDGFAGTQGLLAGTALCVICWSDSVAVTSFCIAMSALGFLFYNWHPARVFMGDVGSISLGFAFATLPFYAKSITAEETVYSTAVFLWFFLADGAFTIIRRLLNKEKIWEAHRTHLYQRLNKTGWAHDKTVIFVMSLAFILTTLQMYLVKSDSGLSWLSFFAGAILFSAYIFTVFFREKGRNS